MKLLRSRTPSMVLPTVARQPSPTACRAPWAAIRDCSSRASSEEGAALVEAGIIVVLLFTLLFAVVQGGMIFGSWIVVTNAAREAARWGSPCVSRAELPFDATCQGSWATVSDAQNTIAEYARTGLPGAGEWNGIAWPDPNSPIWAPAGQPRMLVAANIDDVTVSPRLLHVRIDYAVPLFAPLIGVVLPNPMPLFAQSDMRIEE